MHEYFVPQIKVKDTWFSCGIDIKKKKKKGMMFVMEKVYFTKNITAESLVKIYKKLGVSLNGKIAVKISTGELGGHNYLKPELIKDLVNNLNGTIVECNTAYNGQRNDTKKHLEVVRAHGFDKIANVDIMDAEGEIAIPVNDGIHLDKNYVGKNLKNYDSMLVLSHFKGHVMGGYGGALKNISIGIASSHGKAYIHGVKNPENIWTANHDDFLECMADAAKSVIDYLGSENVIYINVLNNLSIDCDCDSNPTPPELEDIGIMASTDPVALDMASIDAIYRHPSSKKDSLIKRIESLNGKHTIDVAYQLHIGNKEYELVDID